MVCVRISGIIIQIKKNILIKRSGENPRFFLYNLTGLFN